MRKLIGAARGINNSLRAVAWKHVLLWGLAGLLVVLLALGTRWWLWPHDTSIATPGVAAGPAGQTDFNLADYPPQTVDPVIPAGALDPTGAADPVTTISTVPLTTTSTVRQVPAVTVDVVIYGTQTSGIAAAREIAREHSGVSVALISSGEYLESPLAQGLCVEDAREMATSTGGVYGEWRNMVIDHYQALGLEAFTTWGRFAYEPEVANGYLWTLLEHVDGDPILFYVGRLVDASDRDDLRYVTIQSAYGGVITISARYFIDASVEADLARMLGADYRVGRVETVYNDEDGPQPAYPSEENDYGTAPQRLSALLTLRLDPDGAAPPVSEAASAAGIAPVVSIPLSARAVTSFGQSWSMVVAELPNGGRELNETWNDYPDMTSSYDWVLHSIKRPTITQRLVQRALGQISYLQQNGYPEVGIASIPEYLYVREGPRVVGSTTYTADAILAQQIEDVVATGCYVLYDRHDIFPPLQIDTSATVHVPLQALTVADHPWLLVSTAVSTDYRAYSSAVRTEPVRANMGGAAGVIALLAAQAGTAVTDIPYGQVRRLLEERGYRLP